MINRGRIRGVVLVGHYKLGSLPKRPMVLESKVVQVVLTLRWSRTL
jgi:hypothetical protein